jgi:hypothetical protein
MNHPAPLPPREGSIELEQTLPLTQSIFIDGGLAADVIACDAGAYVPDEDDESGVEL